MQTFSPLNLAVLISGGGTTLKNLIDKIAARRLDADIKLVISSSAAADGLKFAAAAEVAHMIVDPADFTSPEEFGKAVFGPCRRAGVDLVAMSGFLKHLLIPADFQNRVMNIHPALIPSFCGRGYYGLKVHRAVLEAGVKVSGCTVHFADDHYDHGPIILQRAVLVEDEDTPESLAKRVFAAECAAYPEAMRLYASGRLRVEGRKVFVD